MNREVIIYENLNGINIPFGFFQNYEDAQKSLTKYCDKGFIK